MFYDVAQNLTLLIDFIGSFSIHINILYKKNQTTRTVEFMAILGYNKMVKEVRMAGMDKPSKTYASPALATTSTPSIFPPQIPDPSLRGIGFDQLLAQRGIRMIHRRAIPCFNISDLDQNTHNPTCSVCDGSGIYYYREKEIYGIFHSNSLEKMFEHHGVWEVGSAVVTLPTEYPDGEEADFNMFDQLVIPDFTSRMWELKEFVPTDDLIQQVRYPIQKIDFIASAANSTVTEYEVGTDLTLTDDGKIQWVDGHEPSYDNVNERGDVFVVSYYANPVYTVLQHMRELRITQELQADGTKMAKRLPQQILVRRDFMRNGAEPEDK